jgi:hypothetical protein
VLDLKERGVAYSYGVYGFRHLDRRHKMRPNLDHCHVAVHRRFRHNARLRRLRAETGSVDALFNRLFACLNRRRLSSKELAAFRAWFAKLDSAAWDRQIEEDVAAGRLGALADEALDDLREGRCTDR